MQPLSEIEQQLQDSIRAVDAYTQENPHVFNTSKLSRRIKSDLRYIQQLLLEPEQEVTWARWQVRQLVYRWFGGWCLPRLGSCSCRLVNRYVPLLLVNTPKVL
jgi:hypothetical protein